MANAMLDACGESEILGEVQPRIAGAERPPSGLRTL
jgi:hypothetical protein